ncbi:MAG: hypothetical protein R3185_05750, partial [Candidatus Thermoplasmatota archaeon]|nr:hypothetical protein [Candidatus Thermoplasmatota archaeon]
MVLSWTPWSIPLLLLAAGEMFLAGVIYRARPDRFQNQVLALLLFAEGITYGSVGLRIAMTHPGDAYAAFITAQVGWLVVFFAYLAFLGTLDTPFSRPLGTTQAHWTYLALFAAGSTFFVLRPETIASRVGPGGLGNWFGMLTDTGNVWWVLTAGPPIYGLFVGISLLRRSTPGTPVRSQARAYLAAFATRDAGYLVAYALGFFAVGSLTSELTWIISMLVSAGFAILLAYGILRTQLLEIELTVKRSVKQGTVVAMLAGASILTSLGARSFMSAEAAQTTGIVLTGLMLFALVPLQRLGGRVADAAMPGVRDDEAYLDQRRLEVYRASLEDALESGGGLGKSEEDRLARLRARLGLTDRDHAVLLHAIEQATPASLTPRFELGRTVLSRYRIE